MEISYDSLLSSQALRNFLSLHNMEETPQELFSVLDKLTCKEFKSGETIIREGDEAKSLYIIDQGQAEVISESSGDIVSFGGLTGGLGGYLLGPVYSYYFFNDLNFLKYHKYFIPLAGAYWRFIFRLLSSSDYREEYSLGLTLPPLSSPDLAYVRLADTWNADIFDCHQCTRCCMIIECPLMDNINHLCRAYDSFFWRYFPCGRYPQNQQQIEYYGCPKWVAREQNTEQSAGFKY